VKFTVLADYDMAILRGSVKGGFSLSFFAKLLFLVPIGSPRNNFIFSIICEDIRFFQCFLMATTLAK
jgi:hypothetical protein